VTVSERLHALRLPAAPPELRRRIIASLDASDQTGARPRRTWQMLAWGGLATAAAAIILTLAIPRADNGLAHPLVQHAIVGLAAEQTLVTSDAQQLGTWFYSQLEYTVQVPAISHATLIGGSVVDLRGVPTAAVAYEMNGRQLTYFASPSTEAFGSPLTGQDVKTVSANGFHVATWTEVGTLRAVVAAMDEEEVAAVAEECKRRATGSFQ
jgi:anti-sigma factor RsiW